MAIRFQCDADTAVVQTGKGRVRGYIRNGIFTFKGIPYAKARRFHAPEPSEPWEGVFEASSFGFVCPLLTNDRPTGELMVPHRFWPMDEDCLNLNIWTPGTDGEKRPVLVWLHGGGFEAGSAIEHLAYEGENMSRLGDTVVVSVNHRLNILGYFDLSDYGPEYANSGNAGGDDIIAALRWVRENIAVFGGDPERVTVFGQSGGGTKVTALLQSPAADGLYNRGVVMSGVIGPLLADCRGSGRFLAEALMAELGIPETGPAGVRALERTDYRLLAKAYLKVKPELLSQGKNVGCTPFPNAFYLGDPAVCGFRKETQHIPLLIGSVFGEFSSFAAPSAPGDESARRAFVAEAAGEEGLQVLEPLFREAYPLRQLSDLMKLDFMFRGPEIPYIQKRSALNKATWAYLFNMDQPVNGGSAPWHCVDVPYFFHNLDLVDFPHGPQSDPGLSERVQELCFRSLMAFAATGNPENELVPVWPCCTPEEEHTLLIDALPQVRTNFDHALIAQQERYMGPAFRRMMDAMQGKVQH
ncbi:MAG: carboxylesterase/lipase family protein [Oscillospiraceae bacterium]|nr:carboxylesterase/lipase family protein [Oscillospiraceae bacterium]